MKINRLFFLLWPPYEANLTDKIIADRNNKMTENARWDLIETKIRSALPKDASNFEKLEYIAKQIQDVESKRKETLENKASTFIVAIGLAISIVSSVPALFSNEKNITIKWAIITSAAYLVAVIHFLVSAYYAVKVRKVAGFAQPCVDSFLDSMNSDKESIEDRIILTLTQTKWNENLLTQKSNYLSVVEDLFLRGLAFVAFATFISIAVNFLHN